MQYQRVLFQYLETDFLLKGYEWEYNHAWSTEFIDTTAYILTKGIMACSLLTKKFYMHVKPILITKQWALIYSKTVVTRYCILKKYQTIFHMYTFYLRVSFSDNRKYCTCLQITSCCSCLACCYMLWRVGVVVARSTVYRLAPGSTLK